MFLSRRNHDRCHRVLDVLIIAVVLAGMNRRSQQSSLLFKPMSETLNIALLHAVYWDITAPKRRQSSGGFFLAYSWPTFSKNLAPPLRQSKPFWDTDCVEPCRHAQNCWVRYFSCLIREHVCYIGQIPLFPITISRYAQLLCSPEEQHEQCTRVSFVGI